MAARLPVAPGRRFARWLPLTPRADLVMVGSEYGGWTIPAGLIDPSWIVYSGGVGDDISFDLGVIERFGCRVFAFDPTPPAGRHVAAVERALDPRFRFLPLGLWSEDRTLRFYAPSRDSSNYSAVNLQGTREHIAAPVRSIPSVMAELGHDRIDLLKLDIEGAEYEALKPVLDGRIRPTVLCVELHKAEGVGLMKDTVGRLHERGYRAVCRRGYDLTLIDRHRL